MHALELDYGGLQISRPQIGCCRKPLVPNGLRARDVGRAGGFEDLRLAEDNAGELYVSTNADGMIRRVVGLEQGVRRASI